MKNNRKGLSADGKSKATINQQTQLLKTTLTSSNIKGSKRLPEQITDALAQEYSKTKSDLLNYNISNISFTARVGVDAKLFFRISKDFKLSVQQLEQMLHISSKTIQNKVNKHIALGPVHSEHILKLMALYGKGVELFRTVDEFNHWLNKPFWLNKEKPIEWLVTPGGIDSVIDELVRMAYGDTV